MDTPQPPVPEGTVPASITDNGDVVKEDQGSVIGTLRNLRKGNTPIGKTKTLTIPGYEGLMGVELQYIDTDVTEEIARAVARETRDVNGKGSNTLAAMDTLARGCKGIVVRGHVDDGWQTLQDHNHPVRFDLALAKLLDFEVMSTENEHREIIIKVYGRDHAVTNHYLVYSRWLTDASRTRDEDFLL